MDEYIDRKLTEEIDKFNQLLIDAEKKLSPEELEEFSQEMLTEVERLTKMVRK